MDLDIAERRFILVGGTGGIGFASSEALSKEGARLVLIGRTTATAEDKAAALETRFGFAAHGIGAEESIEKAIYQGLDLLGGLDGLLVTAGPINSQGGIAELTDADWTEMFETQLMTSVRAVRAALGGFGPEGGSIVLTSAYSIRAHKPHLLHYTAMKAAIANLAKGLSTSLAPSRIRVNCIAPGATATEALEGSRSRAVELYGGDPDEALNRFMREAWGMKVGLDRLGTPGEAADLCAFLLSRRAAYLTGALINIDGGTDF